MSEYKCQLKVIGIILIGITTAATHAATLCVNPGGTAGCAATIGAAVTAAAPGSTIQVAQGVYKESVTITKTLSLVGTGAVIDATGKSTGIFIDGSAAAPNAGVSGVVVSGFTVKNANFEGIVAVNGTGLTIMGNTVFNNNLGLMYSDNSTCPGLPAFETNEGLDCGEGVHLAGVDHSIVSNNDIEYNAGGILISDETGASYQNLISGNKVADNGYDCGITIASHGRAPNLPAGPNFGVFQNTVSHNVVTHNGSLGQGSGVGLYAAAPGSMAAANLVIDNVLTDNGIGGVTMHNHAAPGVNGVPAAAPPVVFSDNMIVGNIISGNSADNDDPLSPGATGISIVSFAPVTGTVISQNSFDGEIADIVFSAPAGTLAAHLNNFSAISIGVANEGTATVDASQNWWGCPGGMGAPGCAGATGSNVVAPSGLPMPFARPPMGPAQ